VELAAGAAGHGAIIDPRRRGCDAWLALLAIALSGCQVAAGTTPDAGACLASGDVFIQRVQPDFLVPLGCGTERDCHDFARGHGTLRLRPWESSPALGTPVAEWPIGWRTNYLSAIQQLDCEDGSQSRLLLIPMGSGNIHPPGPVISDRPAATAVIEAWVAAPR
jgi:hypothetical protein